MIDREEVEVERERGGRRNTVCVVWRSLYIELLLEPPSPFKTEGGGGCEGILGIQLSTVFLVRENRRVWEL